MTADGGTLQQDVSMKAFGLGIGVVALAYALLLGYLGSRGRRRWTGVRKNWHRRRF